MRNPCQPLLFWSLPGIMVRGECWFYFLGQVKLFRLWSGEVLRLFLILTFYLNWKALHFDVANCLTLEKLNGGGWINFLLCRAMLFMYKIGGEAFQVCFFGHTIPEINGKNIGLMEIHAIMYETSCSRDRATISNKCFFSCRIGGHAILFFPLIDYLQYVVNQLACAYLLPMPR